MSDNNNIKPLKVLMMGGRRCGKTSALASMFDQMNKTPVNEFLTISDRTVIRENGDERQDALGDKTLELQNMLEKNGNSNRTFLVDNKPTNSYWLYTLSVQISGTQKRMNIEFRDSAGEFFETSNKHASETRDYVRDCDVFVIVIDTPYLMGPCEENTREICGNSINLGTNRVNDIQNFLTEISDNEGKDAKMVVFVPLKCEKWAREEGGLERVRERVKEVYSTHIKNLMAYKKMNISIIPMQTAGNILFSEMHDALICLNQTGKVDRCCKISDNIVRIEDGRNRRLKENEILKPDPKSVIEGTKMVRPYSWFYVNPESNEYAPKNCDQLPLHILRFMLEKLDDAEKNGQSGEGGFFDWIRRLVQRIKEIFGTMDTEKLKEIINDMQRQGVIKDNEDGIEIIRRF